MANSERRKSPTLGTVLFITIAICGAGTSIFAGRYLYTKAGKPVADFHAKLGELALQLAVVVIVGALVKAMVDWGVSQRSRYIERLDTQKEFMRRIRAMHVTIENSRDLMNAHRSAKTWGEQSRRLMELRPEVEEISEDLRASPDLFTKQSLIVDGLEGIIAYLKEEGEEYVKSHDAVDSGYDTGKNLLNVIEEQNMAWVRDFMAGGEGYRTKYELNLTKAKGSMRAQVYGA